MTLPTVQLYGTDLEITRVGLGAWSVEAGGYPLGWNRQSDENMLATLRRSLELGINWVDTAPAYGFGRSERVLGRFLADLSADVRPLIFTKVGLVWDASNPLSKAISVLRPSVIRNQCEDSLRRLGVDYIDVYQLHWPDEIGTPIEESWAEVQRLVREGKVRYAALSGFGVDLMERCENMAHVHALQGHLSVLDRSALLDTLPWCRDRDTGFLAWGALESGQLCEPTAPHDYPGGVFDGAWNVRRLQRPHRYSHLLTALHRVADRHGCSPAAVAVGWTLSWPGVTATLVGARRPEHIDSWVESAELMLTDDDLDEIDLATMAVTEESLALLRSEAL